MSTGDRTVSAIVSQVPEYGDTTFWSLDNGKRRPWYTAIYMQLVIRLKWLFLQWGGLKPLLLGHSSKPSLYKTSITGSLPKYDLITRFGMTACSMFSGLLRDTKLLVIYYVMGKLGVINAVNWVFTKVHDRLLRQLEESGYIANQRISIPEFDWKDPSNTTEIFFREFVDKKHPVILRGFMKDAELLSKFNYDAIMQRWGQENVVLTRPDLDGFEGKLEEINKPTYYLHNSEVLFNKYPEIRPLLQYQKLEDYSHMKVAYEQAFVGLEGTGTPFHNAANYNFFYMVDGKKRWWFVDPYDLTLLYPVNVFGKAAGTFQVLFPSDANHPGNNLEDYPLFKYCPVFTALLEPGDVLFNPAYWAHAIKNVSPKTVAVASRWHTGGIGGWNSMMTEEDYEISRVNSMGFMIGPSSWGFLHSILQHPSPRYDDHMTLREKNNRFVHKQLVINKTGGIDHADTNMLGRHIANVKTKF
jgi:hypothetical protein